MINNDDSKVAGRPSPNQRDEFLGQIYEKLQSGADVVDRLVSTVNKMQEELTQQWKLLCQQRDEIARLKWRLGSS